jgi:hypothetical protein
MNKNTKHSTRLQIRQRNREKGRLTMQITTQGDLSIVSQTQKPELNSYLREQKEYQRRHANAHQKTSTKNQIHQKV